MFSNPHSGSNTELLLAFLATWKQVALSHREHCTCFTGQRCWGQTGKAPPIYKSSVLTHFFSPVLKCLWRGRSLFHAWSFFSHILSLGDYVTAVWHLGSSISCILKVKELRKLAIASFLHIIAVFHGERQWVQLNTSHFGLLIQILYLTKAKFIPSPSTFAAILPLPGNT